MTVGVPLKAAFIAGVVHLVTGDPRAMILAVAVAQIDPVTVILAFYAVSLTRPGQDGLSVANRLSGAWQLRRSGYGY
ncbi:hypothetical protein [Nonomuraea sp. NPDC049725]|uniref:hypothetical protein n=1 Tax=Nonomuraea sp. NPDC049725 TaxID=3154508 RepID=UPI003437B5E9